MFSRFKIRNSEVSTSSEFKTSYSWKILDSKGHLNSEIRIQKLLRLLNRKSVARLKFRILISLVFRILRFWLQWSLITTVITDLDSPSRLAIWVVCWSLGDGRPIVRWDWAHDGRVPPGRPSRRGSESDKVIRVIRVIWQWHWGGKNTD